MCGITCRTISEVHPRSSEWGSSYVVLGGERHFLSLQVEVGLEVLLSGGVEHAVLEWGSVGGPVAEEQFADVHAIVGYVLEVEHTIAVLVVREGVDEVGPLLFPLAHIFDDLHGDGGTICSTSPLSTR